MWLKNIQNYSCKKKGFRKKKNVTKKHEKKNFKKQRDREK